MTQTCGIQKPLAVALGLSVAVLLTSCSQSGSTASPTAAASATPSTSRSAAPSTSPSDSPSASPKSAGRRIDVTVTGKNVSPSPATVNIAVGESLTIAVTSDHDDRLHVHGFEIAKDIKAGKRLEITVRGGPPGVYDFELHNPELRLFQVAVR